MASARATERGKEAWSVNRGPLSQLLANMLLDEVDRELERRGHCFVRYADDCNVYVRSHRAGERVMALLRRLYGKLKLAVNEAKSAVAGFARRAAANSRCWCRNSGMLLNAALNLAYFDALGLPRLS